MSNKPWSGYNWYKGRYQSLIQYNADITSLLERIIDVAVHEGYPGHHVYNSLFEKNLYRDKGRVEVSLYPLFSPQSLIAEGSANHGISVAFPDKIDYARRVLLPLAGMDTTGLSTYFRVLEIKGRLQHVRTEVTRRLLDGKLTEEEAVNWLMRYALMNRNDAVRSVAFSKKYRSYVINYTLGQDIVAAWMQRQKPAGQQQVWERFNFLLSNQLRPADLMN